MARYTGKDVKITFGAIVAEFKSFSVDVEAMKGESPASDSKYTNRHFDHLDAKMTVTGWEDGGTTGSGQFKAVAALVLSQAAPTALSWTDDKTIPVSMLPADFFTTHFPLSGWRVDKVTGGTGEQGNASEWSAELSCRNS